ncbi:hypothetical protein ACFLWT_01685 [Chloroflexota bacterium]
MDNLTILSIGKDLHLRQGKDHILYTGMPSDNVYLFYRKSHQGTKDTHGIYFIPKDNKI